MAAAFSRRKSSRVAPDPADRIGRKADPALAKPDSAATSIRAMLSPLFAEQQQRDAESLARKAARAMAGASSRRQARSTAGLAAQPTPADAFPSHILRSPDPTLPSQLNILELVAVKIDGMCGEGASSSTEPMFRVGYAEADSDDDADARRRRIYALNAVMYKQHHAAWLRYSGLRSRQINALEKCFEDGATPLARWGLRRFAERCTWMRIDEGVQAERQLKRLAELRQREAESLAKLAQCRAADEKVLRADEEMVQAMPEDPISAVYRADLTPARFCPWYSTSNGCPLHRCPLSHNPLPTELVTYKYRAWALEAHNGWSGERSASGAGFERLI